MRLIEIIKNVPQHLLTTPNLMALTQGLPTEEMGYTPLVKGTNQASQRFGTEITRALQAHTRDMLELYARCKRGGTVVRLDIGTTIGSHRGGVFHERRRIEYGDVRRFADTSTTPMTLIMISVADAGWFDKAFS